MEKRLGMRLGSIVDLYRNGSLQSREIISHERTSFQQLKLNPFSYVQVLVRSSADSVRKDYAAAGVHQFTTDWSVVG